ncbi:SHOCT domain-containing protein [Psychromonas ingrahamii]|uniref:SHOCT domain-containing protein n=1 Tax=Psychromonas ingrahamii TaxID=357794 RepID=UPI000305379E|nr:SHOCT domain-containing protein [Psychromonas ingrahamii]
MIYSWHFMPFWGHILMMLVWVGLFMLIINYQSYGTKKESSIDIAKKRYAQGEIDEEQFNKIKNNL